MDYRIRVKDLLYLISCITNLIHNEIEDIMRGRGRTNEEIKESVLYIIEERFGYMSNK